MSVVMTVSIGCAGDGPGGASPYKSGPRRSRSLTMPTRRPPPSTTGRWPQAEGHHPPRRDVDP
jgi:hypothetical protein